MNIQFLKFIKRFIRSGTKIKIKDVNDVYDLNYETITKYMEATVIEVDATGENQMTIEVIYPPLPDNP